MQHNTWEEKSLFCKLDCSQAYHCLQMADQRSVEMLAFNFASKTFANKRLAQGLSRSLFAFSSFMCKYSDPVVKTDKSAQYLDGLQSQPIIMRTLSGTFGQSSSVFARQDSNWQLKIATLDSDMLNSQVEPFHPREYHNNLTTFRTS